MNDQLKGQIKDRILYRPDSLVKILVIQLEKNTNILLLL